MTTREAINHTLDELTEEQMREVLAFSNAIRQDRDAAIWHLAGRDRLAQAYGQDEPQYTETMVKPELDQ